MNKNVGRDDPDHKPQYWWDYRDAMPGTPEQVAARLGVSQRVAEKTLLSLRRLGMAERRGEEYHVSQLYLQNYDVVDEI